MDDNSDMWFLGAAVVLIFVVVGIFAHIWASHNPYSYKARYCAGQLCDTMTTDDYTNTNACPPYRSIDTGFASDVTGELDKSSCQVWKR